MEYKCSYCPKSACLRRDESDMPEDCPSLNEELMGDVRSQYIGEVDSKLSYQSAMTRIKATELRSRLDETVDFIHRCGYTNVGLAFCKMVRADAAMVVQLLEREGLKVNSVVCSVGGVSDEILEREDETIFAKKGYETMCNPVGQAAVLEAAGSQFNILMGLCVGHDTMFILHSKAPMTVLGVKDRKLGCTKIF